jgi:hypothetical protein
MVNLRDLKFAGENSRIANGGFWEGYSILKKRAGSQVLPIRGL